MKRNAIPMILLSPDGVASGGGAPTNTPPAAPPAGWVSPEERNKAIEKARQEEKDKLYGQIQSLQQKLEKAEKDLTASQQLCTELEGKVAAFGKVSNGGKEIDVAKLMAEVAETSAKQVRAEYEPRLQALDGEVTTVKQQNRKMSLDKYRATKIQEIGEQNLILELVKGDSEAEIDAAIATSQQAVLNMKQKLGISGSSSTPNPATATGGTAGGATPPVLPQPKPNTPGSNGVPSAREIPLKDWGKNRDELKRQMAQRYTGR